ncbi:IS110 family transposase [Mesorhizobium sp. M0954]|uniref:IS110 family transposase n=1 Tax=Mesorhizobium sp. M0954 TaxID=2957032 RepID=UPI0033368DB6
MTRKTQPRRKRNLTLVNPNAAAIDIGATILVAAVSPRCDPEPVRTFGTFTADLHRLAAWLEQCGVKTVAMESTGVYWIPLFEILEQHGFDAILVNAREAKQVPGRKSDVSDAEWLQRLHKYGLLRASFRPTGEIATLQSYLRQRERLLDAAATHIQHMQKALTEMNLQLHHVVTDVTGATGLRIMRALVGGERDPDKLAPYRDPHCKASAETLRAALVGNDREEHVFALAQALELYEIYQVKVAACDERIAVVLERMKDAHPAPPAALPPPRYKRPQACEPGVPVREALHAILGVDLTQIHGIGPYLALKLVSECGTDLSAWPTSKHFTSWLSLAPHNKISGARCCRRARAAPAVEWRPCCGWRRRRWGALRRRWAPSIAAWPPALKAKAVTATARKIAVFSSTTPFAIAWTTLDPGASYYEEGYRQRVLSNVRRRAKSLGYALQRMEPTPAAAVS